MIGHGAALSLYHGWDESEDDLQNSTLSPHHYCFPDSGPSTVSMCLPDRTLPVLVRDLSLLHDNRPAEFAVAAQDFNSAGPLAPPAAAAAAVVDSPQPGQHDNSSYGCAALKMQSIPTAEELAHLQKLSNEYEPVIEGPLVGELRSSEAITSEYAQADPIYVQKTALLPRKYSHYRTVKGDGNCGWRAIAFSYFETLQRIGDKGRLLAEETRLRSLNNLLNTAGFEEHLYEDFVEESINLLRIVAASLPTSPHNRILLEKFNDPGVSSAIITHLRLLTSAWMKTRPEGYQPFILDGSVDQYCATQIEPYQVEIEHIGMNAIIDALVKPAGFAVEISYLDRSAGTEVNEHRFEARNPDGTPLYGAPTIRLLYRPGHYDILYKAQDVGTAFAPTQVALVDVGYSDVQDLPNASPSGGLTPYLAAIPGMSYVTMPNCTMVPVGLSTNGSISESHPSSPVAPLSPSFPSPALPQSPTTTENGGTSFRHSKYEYEAFFPSSAQHRPFQTATFRNSHFNPAHFRNSDFQPEMWTPECEDARSPRDELGRHH